MSRPKIKLVSCALLAATGLAGCSDLYWDRRDAIELSAGNSLRGNEVVHMVDPWPATSANRNISYNGEKLQSAVERYRQNKVTPPSQGNTSSAGYQILAPVTTAKP